MPRRKLPDPVGPGTLDFDALECEGYQVMEWSDDPVPGRTPPCAVVLMLRCKLDGMRFGVGLRMKSDTAVNELIDALERHRVGVFK